MNMPQLPQFCIAMCWWMYSTVSMPVVTVLYCHAVAVLWTCQLPQFRIAMWLLYCEHASCHSVVLPCCGCTVNMPVATVPYCHVTSWITHALLKRHVWDDVCFVLFFFVRKLKLKRYCTTRNFSIIFSALKTTIYVFGNLCIWSVHNFK